MIEHNRLTRFLAPAAAALGSLASSAAQAHEGHGLSGMHWHPTDVVGFVAVAVAAAAAVWLIRRK